jgi:hypothetical protein
LGLATHPSCHADAGLAVSALSAMINAYYSATSSLSLLLHMSKLYGLNGYTFYDLGRAFFFLYLGVEIVSLLRHEIINLFGASVRGGFFDELSKIKSDNTAAYRQQMLQLARQRVTQRT